MKKSSNSCDVSIKNIIPGKRTRADCASKDLRCVNVVPAKKSRRCESVDTRSFAVPKTKKPQRPMSSVVSINHMPDISPVIVPIARPGPAKKKRRCVSIDTVGSIVTARTQKPKTHMSSNADNTSNYTPAQISRRCISTDARTSSGRIKGIFNSSFYIFMLFSKFVCLFLYFYAFRHNFCE